MMPTDVPAKPPNGVPPVKPGAVQNLNRPPTTPTMRGQKGEPEPPTITIKLHPNRNEVILNDACVSVPGARIGRLWHEVAKSLNALRGRMARKRDLERAAKEKERQGKTGGTN